jgi:hypothetical protein
MTLFPTVLAVILFGPSATADLPTGTWKVQYEGLTTGDLVIIEVKPDGKLCGTAFGQPLYGTWDGEVLSFRVDQPYPAGHRYLSFSGRLVRDQQGLPVRYLLTGTQTGHISACYEQRFLPPREWKAHLEVPAHEK